MCEYCEGDRELAINKYMIIKIEKFINNLTLKIDTKENTHTRIDLRFCPMCRKKVR